MKRSFAAVVAALGALALVAMPIPAGATSETVTIPADLYQPKTLTTDTLGITIQWDNQDTDAHTATGDTPWHLWNTGVIAASTIGQANADWAGSLPYHCKIHTFMHGTIRVRIGLVVVLGGVELHMAVADAPAGLRYELQRRVPGGKWRTIHKGTSAVFTDPKTTGVWDYRSRVVHVKSGKATGWSPKARIDLDP